MIPVTEASIPARRTLKREPVFEGKHRVRGLWQRRTAEGHVTYESQMRIDGGNPRRVVHRDVLTKTEAIAAHRRLTVGVDTGDVQIGDRTLTVRAMVDSFVARERGILATRSKSTVDLYELRLERHVLPLVGTLKADAVTVQHVRSLIDKLTAKKHSGSSVRGCLAALSAAFRHGERDLGAVRRNPVRDLDRDDRPSGKRQSEPRYLSVSEVGKLLSKMSDEMRPIAAALFYGGLRVSEALALTWGEIGFDTSTLIVNGTKTDASAATIPLLPALADELRAHRERQAVHGFDRLRAGSLVFQTAGGRPVHRRNVLRAVTAAAGRAGLNGGGREPVGCHDLRHSCAAFAFSLGMTSVEVSRLLRHSDPAVTLTVYAGLDDASVRSIGDKLAAGLKG
jgi:integrase